MKKISKETIGEIFVGFDTLTWAAFPVLISYGAKIMPPILFASLGYFVSSVVIFLYLIFRGQLSLLKNKKAFFNILMIVIFIVILPSIFLFKGTRLSSGINTSLLMQMEIVFTFLIYSLIGFEKITFVRIIGAILAIIGSVFVMYNGSFSVNYGELLIILAVFFYPIGNIFAKKALGMVSPIVILFYRGWLGGLALLIISFLIEDYGNNIFEVLKNGMFVILISGTLVHFISKLFWYGALKRIDVNKAVLLGSGSTPAVSMLYAYMFLGEVPNINQWIGFLLILCGIFVVVMRRRKGEVVEVAVGA
jgi:drug/metabolite transporter (DMT)-like permease